MTKLYTTLFLLFTATGLYAQQTFEANDNAGFGGFFGSSSMVVNDDGTTITFTLTSESGNFNDGFVFYFDTGAEGRSVIDTNVEDSGDSGRRAISNANDQGNGSIVTFPTDFEARYALHADSGFAGIFEIPATGTVGNNELNYVTSGNIDNTTPSVVIFTIDFADLGITATDSFDFVGIYGNSGNAFTSNEGYGLSSSITENIGGNDFSFEQALTYTPTTASVDDLTKANLTMYYTNNSLNFKGYDGDATIEIFNTLGQKVASAENQTLYDGYRLPVELTRNNLYIVRTSAAGGTVARKIIVQ